ncbi:response regulator transcription factor [Patulibacter minatonensis]|uniref:response regulator transcription factor n=1 Tax=Patulibacter minatonensis TaxID=298163 RepID=UPI000688005C|nr:response regulator transcription factor [Patulibacter minatonensis]
MTRPSDPSDERPVPLRVALADDHEVVRRGLRLVLESESDIRVVAEAGSAEAARRAVLGHKPDVLVLDLNMPGESSLDAIPRMLAESPATAVVVLTMQDDPAFARAALLAGARGYVLKDAASNELVRALRVCVEGGTYLHPSLGARIAAAPEPAGPPDDLSPRELEVLRMVALGHTNTEIAELLFLSVRTVESHRASVQQKAGRSTRAELVAYALEHELIGAAAR